MAEAKPRKARAGRKASSKPAADQSPTTTGLNETPALSIQQASELGSPNDGPIEEEIRRRAYELYLQRGGGEGNDLSDWLEAERLVRNSRA